MKRFVQPNMYRLLRNGSRDEYHLADRADGTKRIADGTLVALTLMIAESRMDEMDILVKVVVNLINRKQ